MTGWFVVLPLVLIAAAAILSRTFVKRSSVQITKAGVEIRNYPQEPKVIPLTAVDRFVPTERVGMFGGLRPATAVLILYDGSRLAVRALGDPEAGYGIERLNARVAAARTR